jgi:glycosyltransferase involved in cell wall biosynthesis
LPVISTNAGAIGEFVKNGENGFMVDDVKTFGQAVQNGLTRHWDRKQIAASMESCSWACCARQVAEVYRALLPEAR